MKIVVTGDFNSCPGKAPGVESWDGVARRIMGAHSPAARGVTRKGSLKEGDTMAFKSIGYHRSTSGRKYDLQFDLGGKLAQAILLPKGFGAGHVVLAFRAESEEEALSMLVKALDSGSLY